MVRRERERPSVPFHPARPRHQRSVPCASEESDEDLRRTGKFAGLVALPGTVRVTLIPGTPADSAQFRAPIIP
jgi:hypothetical protein